MNSVTSPHIYKQPQIWPDTWNDRERELVLRYTLVGGSADRVVRVIQTELCQSCIPILLWQTGACVLHGCVDVLMTLTTEQG